MSKRLEQKVAIVTGAGSGIGRAAAARFAAEGARVVCVDIVEESVHAVADEIGEAGGQARAVPADVARAADVRAMAEAAIDVFGTIDILFANAGVGSVGTAVDTNEDEWDRVVGIMLKGVWLCSKYVLPHMLDAGHGSIVNTASIGGFQGQVKNAAYAAAKGGVLALTRQMATDYGPAGIRVNAIAPAMVRTPLLEGVYASGGGVATADTLEERLKQGAEVYLLGRPGTPDEIANVALFLASDEAAWVTGSIYVVDGGRSAGLLPRPASRT